MVDFAAFGSGGAVFASAVPVSGDDGFDLGFGGVSVGASHPEGLSFAVEHHAGNGRGADEPFQHSLRQRFTANDLSDAGRVVAAEAFDVGYGDELVPGAARPATRRVGQQSHERVGHTLRECTNIVGGAVAAAVAAPQAVILDVDGLAHLLIADRIELGEQNAHALVR